MRSPTPIDSFRRELEQPDFLQHTLSRGYLQVTSWYHRPPTKADVLHELAKAPPEGYVLHFGTYGTSYVLVIYFEASADYPTCPHCGHSTQDVTPTAKDGKQWCVNCHKELPNG